MIAQAQPQKLTELQLELLKMFSWTSKSCGELLCKQRD